MLLEAGADRSIPNIEGTLPVEFVSTEDGAMKKVLENV